MFSYKWVGLSQYQCLWDNDCWWVVSKNLLFFGGLFIVICLVFGVFFVVLLDQCICCEGFICIFYLYFMVLLMIVIGIVWKWLFNLGLGLDKLFCDWGWEGFCFDWLVDLEWVVYCLVIVVVWQVFGFVMVLFFVGLCGVDLVIVCVVQVDGVSLLIIYLCIVLLSLCLVFFSVLMIFVYIVIKSFDLVVVMIVGGLGYFFDLLVMFMYVYIFICGQMGFGVVSVMLMFGVVLVIVVFYLYFEL